MPVNFRQEGPQPGRQKLTAVPGYGWMAKGFPGRLSDVKVPRFTRGNARSQSCKFVPPTAAHKDCISPHRIARRRQAMASTINPLRTAYHILFESTQRPREFIDNSPKVRGPLAEIPNPIWRVQTASSPYETHPLKWGASRPTSMNGFPRGSTRLRTHHNLGTTFQKVGLRIPINILGRTLGALGLSHVLVLVAGHPSGIDAARLVEVVCYMRQRMKLWD